MYSQLGTISTGTITGAINFTPDYPIVEMIVGIAFKDKHEYAISLGYFKDGYKFWYTQAGLFSRRFHKIEEFYTELSTFLKEHNLIGYTEIKDLGYIKNKLLIDLVE
jgi:hypothetical protein